MRWFGHPFGADRLGASLHEFLPGAPGGPLHLHYGVEEMFFVLAGKPVVRTPEGEHTLAPGDVVYFPEGPEGLHDFSNPADEPARILAVSTKRFPDVVAYPERGVAWVATRHPERPVGESAGSVPASIAAAAAAASFFRSFFSCLSARFSRSSCSRFILLIVVRFAVAMWSVLSSVR
jgi:uncharacterized cupin superfamily protein